MKTAVAKVMWVGRASVFLVGLAVILALTVGFASTVLAAVPGDPFKLGRINTIDKATHLVGSANNAMLRIDNDSKAPNATALELEVDPKKPPIRTNSLTKVQNLHADLLDGRSADQFANGVGGTAVDADHLDGKDSSAFLGVDGKAKAAANADFASFAGDAQNAQAASNADKLDGKDSTAFASGTNGVANNANALDGKDSSDFVSSTFGTAPNANNLDGWDSTRFFSGKTYTAENSRPGPGDSGVTSRIATCDQGDNAIGGGGGSLADDPMLDSSPLGSRSWFVAMQDDLGESEIRATVLCADFPPLR